MPHIFQNPKSEVEGGLVFWCSLNCIKAFVQTQSLASRCLNTCTWLIVSHANKFLHISSLVAAIKKGEKTPTIYNLPTSSHSSQLHGVCSPPAPAFQF